MGNIHLHLHHTIGYQFNSEESPAALWLTLKKKYGAPGMPTAFKEFKGIMDTVIPNNSDPNPAIDKILAHHARLVSMKWDISSKSPHYDDAFKSTSKHGGSRPVGYAS